MALIFSYTAENGAIFGNAYGRIVQLEGTVQRMTATMRIYVSETARHSGKSPVSIEQAVFAPDLADGAPNLFSQAYAEFRRAGKFVDPVIDA